MLLKLSEQIVYCYERAGESRTQAANCLNERDKQEHLELERRWLTLARSYELSERIGRFNDEYGRRLRVLIPSEPSHPTIPLVRCSGCAKRMRLSQIVPCLPTSRLADAWTFICECGLSCEQVVDRRPAPTGF